MTILRCLLIFLSTITIAGCASGFAIIDKLPSSEAEFVLKPGELRSKYPDIDKYDRSALNVLFVNTWNLASVDSIKSDLGEPDDLRLSWWNLMYPGFVLLAGSTFPPVWIAGLSGLFVLTNPYLVYTWYKMDYKIEVLAYAPMIFGWNAQMIYWRWHYDRKWKRLGMTQPRKNYVEL